MATKVCNRCGEDKELSEFYSNKTTRDGKSCTCKVCVIVRAKLHYAGNKEKISLSQKQYRFANKEKIARQRKRYWNTNKEKLTVRQKRYRELNKEKIALGNKLYVDDLKDFYVKALLKDSNWSVITPELIKLKRIQVQIKREIQEQQT